MASRIPAPPHFLRTERPGFRSWTEDDLGLALGLWGDPEVTRLIDARGRLSREHVRLRPHDPPAPIYELGLHIRSLHWRRGFAAEAASAVIRHGFGRLQAAGLFAGHHPDNHASRRLLTKLGFRYTHDELYPPTGLLHPSYMLMPARGSSDGAV